MKRTTKPVTDLQGKTPSGMVRTSHPKTAVPPISPTTPHNYKDNLNQGTKRNNSLPKDMMFAKEYIIDFNATRAAKAAGYSERSAHVIGCKLLKKDKVREYIQEEMDKRCGRLEVTADRVLLELARISFLDPRTMFDDNGDLLPIAEMDDDAAAAISGLEIKENWSGRGDNAVAYLTKKMKLVDKKGSLDLLGKHLKLWTEKHEHAGPGGTPLPQGQSTVIILPAKKEVA